SPWQSTLYRPRQTAAVPPGWLPGRDQRPAISPPHQAARGSPPHARRAPAWHRGSVLLRARRGPPAPPRGAPAHVQLRPTPLETERFEFSRESALVGGLLGQPLVAALVPALLVPDLELVALADEHHLPVDGGEVAQLLRQQDPPLPVQLDLGGVADHQSLQAARLAIQRGQSGDATLDVLPFGERVHQQAVVAVDGDDQLVAAAHFDARAIARRDREA